MLRLSSFPDAFPSITEQFFSNPKSRSKGDMDMNANSLRQTLDVVQSNNFRIADRIIRSGPQAREKMLEFWGRACALNAKRAGMRVKGKEVSTDAFMVNLFELAVRFAEPFMDPAYSKIDRIDMEYFRYQKRFDASNLTRLRATEPEANRWAEEDQRKSRRAICGSVRSSWNISLQHALHQPTSSPTRSISRRVFAISDQSK